MTKTDLAALLGEIDLENAVIRNVSVITEGEAKGHGMMVDAQTLREVKEAAETYSGGLKVKTDHFSGFNQIVGVLKNFVIDDAQLRADLFLLKKHEATERILEMARLMPDTFGLSISFSGQHQEKDGEETFARCNEIYSADLVDSPAANPTGLFSAIVDSGKTNMDEKDYSAALAEALAPIHEKLAAFEAFIGEANTRFEALASVSEMPDDEKADEGDADKAESDDSNDQSEENMSEKLAAELAEIKSLVANFGAAPVAVATSQEVVEAKEPTNFNEALEVVKAEGLKGSAATKEVIARFPELYLAARSEGIRTL